MSFPSFASGEVLTAADMNAVGLWLVKTQTIGAGVPSVVVNDAFSSDYEDYLVTVTGGTSTAVTVLTIQMGATTSGYKWSLIYNIYGTTGITAISSAAGTSFNYMGIGLTAGGGGLNMAAQILSPQLAKNTHARTLWSASSEAGTSNGVIENSTQYTGFTLGVSTGTITGGTIRVYGYRK
jgi:hypothetical protein